MFACRNCEYNFDFPREIGVFHEIWSVLSCTGLFVKYFNRELWLKKIIIKRGLSIEQLGDGLKLVFSPDIIQCGGLGQNSSNRTLCR